MKRIVISPYQLASKGARLLADALDTIRVRPNGKYVPKRNHIVVNWGQSAPPPWTAKGHAEILNKFDAVKVATNKLLTFKALDGKVPIPEFTTDIKEAEKWFEKKKAKVVCRTLLRASEGRGIVVADAAAKLVAAPLYVRFVPKDVEYRVHVFRGTAIHVQQKRLRNGLQNDENRNQYIRNTANGWVFTIEHVECPIEVQEEAVKAVTALGLDFGAVDVAVSKKQEVVIFEVNTAPGIEGTTVNKYADVLKGLK